MVAPVADFSLYGEPPRQAAAGFLHVEALDIRSRPANWTIHSHAHRDLVQLFFVARGGGEMHADGGLISFEAPCLVLMPAETIHAFDWAPDSSGHVLTIGLPTFSLVVARAPEFARLFARPATVVIPRPETASLLETLMRRLTAENAWDALGHGPATDALLTLILVESVRILGIDTDASARDAALIAQFRTMIEGSFRERPALAHHLARLGVSERRLRDACREVAGRTPMQMVLDRTMLEARRMLVSSNRSAAEIGYQLGFADPAYFSRAFRAHVGQSLRGFRKATRA